MAHHQTHYDQSHYHQQHDQQHLAHKVAKTTTAMTIGGSLMVLSGLTLVATVIGLAIATPVLVIFSPVIVPAGVTLLSLFAGFLTSSGVGAMASFVLHWMYRYATGKHPPGAEQLDRARDKISHAAWDIKQKAEHFAHEQSPDTRT